jgi:hypothetical protein
VPNCSQQSSLLARNFGCFFDSGKQRASVVSTKANAVQVISIIFYALKGFASFTTSFVSASIVMNKKNQVSQRHLHSNVFTVLWSVFLWLIWLVCFRLPIILAESFPFVQTTNKFWFLKRYK